MKSWHTQTGSLLSVILIGGQAATLLGASPQRPPAHREIRNGWTAAQLAIKKFQLAPGFKIQLFAAEPQLRNPVAFCLDEKGRLYVAETDRYRTSVFDIRDHMDWYMDDLACRTIDDRKRMLHKYLGNDLSALSRESERIRLLEDRDHDGRAEISKVYAGGFTNVLDGIAAGVLARKGEVFFTNIPNLWKLRDQDGDGKADSREVLSRGYGVRFSLTGHDLHGLRFGPDGKLYFTVGDRGAHVVTREGRTLAYPDEGVCFRIDPDGSHLEVFAQGLRNPQELAFDNYGNLFTGDNDSDHGDRERFVHLVEGGDSGWRVGYQFSEQNPAGVWNAERLWHLRFPGQAAYLLPPIAHIDNGPSGLAYYPGTGLPETFRGRFFLCHFKGVDTVSGIRMLKLQQTGATFKVVDQSKLIWNILPTDVDFGPDGFIYLTDWVYGWPKSERGRIYRISYPETINDPIVKQTQSLLAEGMDGRGEAELGDLLAHPDGRVRQAAQFELASRNRKALGTLLRVARETGNQLARIHAIWALGQMAHGNGHHQDVVGYLTEFLRHKDPETRAQAARVCYGDCPNRLAPRLMPLLKDPSPRVEFYAAMSLGKLGNPSAVRPVIQMIRKNHDQDLYLRHAGVMALTRIHDRRAVIAAGKDSSDAVRMAALLTMRRWHDPGIAMFLRDAEPRIRVEAARAINDLPIQAAFGPLARAADALDLAGFHSVKAPKLDLATPYLRRILNANFRLGRPGHARRLASMAVNKDLPSPIRSEAVAMLGEWAKPGPRDRVVGLYRPLPEREPHPARTALISKLDALLGSDQEEVAASAAAAVARLGLQSADARLLDTVKNTGGSERVRVAALRALGTLNSEHLDEALSLAKQDYSIALRTEATRLLAKGLPETAAPELNAVLEHGTLREQQAALATLATLEGSIADEIILGWVNKMKDRQSPPELALDILEAAWARSDSRIEEALAYWKATLPPDDPLGEDRAALYGGDAAEGRSIFFENTTVPCVRCHRVKGEGGDVGPDMTEAGKRYTREHILESILYPNRTIAKGFESVIVYLKNGDAYAGIVKQETDDKLVLNSPEDGIVTVSKKKIESREKGLSGMPEGVDKLLSRFDLRNLVAFLASRGS